MTKDCQLSVKVRFDTLKKIDDYAKAHNCNRSVAVRHAVESLLTNQKSKKQQLWDWFKKDSLMNEPRLKEK